MKNKIKSGIKWLIDLLFAILESNYVGRFVYECIIYNIMNRTQKVDHQGVNLVMSIPNGLNKYRANTFSTKEPETLEWFDNMPTGSVVWDIGANVGLYSCYAAKHRNCRVFAFEPSVFNLEILARNIFLNDLMERITIVPLPLSDELAVSTLNMTSTEWGGSMSTFGQAYGHDGEVMSKVFELPTIGLSMVEADTLLKVPQPDYIKMDVDGIEHLILKGGMPVLRGVMGILIEINDKFVAQASDANNYLQEAGLVLKEKRHADYYDSVTSAARYTFNQIWIRK